MFKKVTKILLTIALTGWMGVANATLIFDFSLDSNGGKISGQIFGLLDNVQAQSATAVIITEIHGDMVNFDLTDGINAEFGTNDFSVSGGELVSFIYQISKVKNNAEIDLHLRFNYHGIPDAFVYSNHINKDYITANIRGLYTLSRVTVPEPSTVILMLLGLAGLSFARYRKQY